MNPLAASAWACRSAGMPWRFVASGMSPSVGCPALGCRTRSIFASAPGGDVSVGISEEHAELASSLRKWAGALGGPDLVRAAEGDAAATFEDVWAAVGEMGVAAIAVP